LSGGGSIAVLVI